MMPIIMNSLVSNQISGFSNMHIYQYCALAGDGTIDGMLHMRKAIHNMIDYRAAKELIAGDKFDSKRVVITNLSYLGCHIVECME